MSDEFEYFYDCDMGDLDAKPEAIDAGLLTMVGSDIHLTAAGLFAMVGQLSADLSVDTDGRLRKAFDRALYSAQAAGLQWETEQEIRRSFSKGIDPGDGSKNGLALAALCRLVAEIARREEIIDLLDLRNCV